MSDLDLYRQQINEIDAKMAKLFEERMNVCRDIAAYKQEHGLPIKNVEREASLTEKSSQLISDPDIVPYYVGFQRSTIDISCAFQAKLMHGMRVAYSGVKGAFAYIAAKRMFPDAELVEYLSFEDAYKSTENGETDCAVLPIENSSAGEVGTVMDLAFNGSLYINREGDLEISQNLLAVEGATTATIKTVVSHPQALAQCREFIEKHGYETIEYSNTARAAQFVKESNDITVAAIASEDTAEIFGLNLLEGNINTSKNNATRFVVLSRSRNLPGKDNKKVKDSFTLVFTVPNTAGALALTLDIIGAHGFSMKNVKSRPMKDLKWSYYFYIEAEGNIASEHGQDMMSELAAVCDRLKLLGSYNSDTIM